MGVRSGVGGGCRRRHFCFRLSLSLSHSLLTLDFGQRFLSSDGFQGRAGDGRGEDGLVEEEAR